MFIILCLQVAQSSDTKLRPKASGLLKLLKSQSLMVFMHFLHDVLATLGDLSRDLQRREASLYECHQKVETTKSLVAKYASRPGFHLKKVINENSLQGEHLHGSQEPYNSASQRIIPRLVECLEGRFEDINQGVLAATRLADTKTRPTAFDEEFGDDLVENLVSHFSQVLEEAGVNIESIDREWAHLKTMMYNNHKIQDVTWIEMNERYKGQVPNILSLVDLVLALPASTAECERGFSTMGVMKTQYRVRLSSRSMTAIMSVKMLSKDISEFDPTAAIHYWNSSGSRSRRPWIQPRSGRTTGSSSLDASAAAAAASTPLDEAQPVAAAEKEDSDSSVDSDFSFNFDDVSESNHSDDEMY